MASGKTFSLNLLILCIPARGATHHRQIQRKTMVQVLYRRRRRAELYRHIGRYPLRPLSVVINGTRHRVPALQRQSLDGVSHLAVAYDGYLHFLRNLKSLPR